MDHMRISGTEPSSVVLKRVQLPLKLEFAITVHKTHDMNLRSAVVNCENCI